MADIKDLKDKLGEMTASEMVDLNFDNNEILIENQKELNDNFPDTSKLATKDELATKADQTSLDETNKAVDDLKTSKQDKITWGDNITETNGTVNVEIDYDKVKVDGEKLDITKNKSITDINTGLDLKESKEDHKKDIDKVSEAMGLLGNNLQEKIDKKADQTELANYVTKDDLPKNKTIIGLQNGKISAFNEKTELDGAYFNINSNAIINADFFNNKLSTTAKKGVDAINELKTSVDSKQDTHVAYAFYNHENGDPNGKQENAVNVSLGDLFNNTSDPTYPRQMHEQLRTDINGKVEGLNGNNKLFPTSFTGINGSIVASGVYRSDGSDMTVSQDGFVNPSNAETWVITYDDNSTETVMVLKERN